MRKEIMIVSIVFLLFLAGCTSKDDAETFEPEDFVDDTLDDSSDDYYDDSGEDYPADEPVANNDENTMRFCESTEQTDMIKYEYYWTEDEFYERVATSNGGEALKVATPDTVCVMLEGSAVDGWDCSAGSEALFQETVGTIEDLLNSPVNMYGFVCEDVPYDKSVFDVSQE